MKLSNLTKYYIFLGLFSLSLSACGGASTTTGNTATEPADNKAIAPADAKSIPAADAVRTEPPYQNPEPTTFQTEVWHITATGTEKFLLTRKDAKWRVDNAYGDPAQTSTLHTDKDYVLSLATKTYAEVATGHGFDERASMMEAVTRGLINGRDKAVYEKTGTENGMTKYRIIGEPGKPVETLLTIDDKLGLPVMKEVYTLEGGRKLAVTVKLVGFKTEVDDKAFDIAKDFKKVPLEEMQKTLVPDRKPKQ